MMKSINEKIQRKLIITSKKNYNKIQKMQIYYWILKQTTNTGKNDLKWEQKFEN